ncbi:unnamed protein product, partial [Rotaria magnacalcarata]
MTTTTIERNEYWNNVLYDQSFDFDDIFSSALNFISYDEFNSDFILEKKENKATQNYSEIPPNNYSTQESQMQHSKCGICGTPALGYNFNQITCESCKAFFRRNPLRYMPDLKCRFSGRCVINIETRRQCTYCQLKKCFDIKMPKEQKRIHQLSVNQQFLLSRSTVLRTKNRPIICSQKVFGHRRNLSSEDHMLFNNIIIAYQLGENHANGLSINNCISSASLVQYLNEQNMIHESLIYFYKPIPEFKKLRVDDQMLLTK